MRTGIRAATLIKVVGLYSCLVVGLLSVFVFSSDEMDVHDRAIMKMALGLILLWIIVGGSLMYWFREPISVFVRQIPLNWRIKFVLFCTVLALLEEVITVSMTNLAPFFGSEIGKAFITGSANYLHTVLFHSVIAFVPMFIAWAFLLGRYDFSPPAAFLLFGLTGSIGEMTMQPYNILGGFWFFVYGLVIFLPVSSLPPAERRGAIPPRARHYVLAVVLPIISIAILIPLAPLISWLYRAMDPVFFVDNVFE